MKEKRESLKQRTGFGSIREFVDAQMVVIKEQVGDERVLLALSGGVDSSVVAAMLSRAIPGQTTCIFVDHGLMRKNEGNQVEEIFSKRDVNFVRVNAESRFLGKLKSITEPEQKRKVIGEEFVRVFEDESKKLKGITFLAQGTIYPDIIESGGGKHGATIKSHHNVGGLPKELGFKGLVEPVKMLYKDEVREVGRLLGLPGFLVNRQPFPGPGLGVRCIGELTKDRLDILRDVDAIFREELDKLKKRPNQYFAVLTDTLSVGMRDGVRTYDPVVALRAVVTGDYMTCEYMELSHRVLRNVSKRITTEVPSVSRVVYDISCKPPATIEWE